MAIVALAGPFSNLLMALLWVMVMKLSLFLPATLAMATQPLLYMGAAGITINLVLLVLNLVPIPPLDGSRIVSSFLPDKMAWRYNQLEQYGLLILLLLLATGGLHYIIGPPLNLLQTLIYQLAAL
jgi:Zn-dependent protease